MKTKLLLGIIIFSQTVCIAQNEPNASEIVEKATKKNNNYKTIQADFKLTTTLPQSKPQYETGKLMMKGDKYRISLTKSDIWSDGKSIYTHIKESKELNITKPEPIKKDKGNFFLSNPRDIFKLNNKNFKSKFIQETSNGSITNLEIDLIPNDLKTQYSSIHIVLIKNSLLISSIKLNMKDGTKMLIELSGYLTNETINDDLFKFDEHKFSGVQVNDMRF